jgi:hypothetical protein
MTDLITRARKEWVTPFPYAYVNTEVVAALLEIVSPLEARTYCTFCTADQYMHRRPHNEYCPIGIAEAAITRALEGK